MTMLTIGQLAQRAGLHTSTLRFYEEQGLLAPVGRTVSGYRLYAPAAVQVLQFIQRAQRLGFSLADIHTLLQTEQNEHLDMEAVLSVAERRYLALERQVTGLLIQRHELEQFLSDLHHTAPASADKPLFERLLDRVCPTPLDPPTAVATLEWLTEHTGCGLTSAEEQALLEALRGRHSHIWQEADAYHILVVGQDPNIEAALRELAVLEAACHAHPAPQVETNEEGYLLTVQGENAFIFARLFLALEQG